MARQGSRNGDQRESTHSLTDPLHLMITTWARRAATGAAVRAEAAIIKTAHRPTALKITKRTRATATSAAVRAKSAITRTEPSERTPRQLLGRTEPRPARHRRRHDHSDPTSPAAHPQP
jgi:hypothetical protein